MIIYFETHSSAILQGYPVFKYYSLFPLYCKN